jgi:hypothetical protein
MHTHAGIFLTRYRAEIRLHLPFPGGVPLGDIQRTDLEIHLRGNSIPQVDLNAPGIKAVLLGIDETSRDNVAGRIDGFRTRNLTHRDQGNPSVFYAHIAHTVEVTFRVHDTPVQDNDIELFR